MHMKRLWRFAALPLVVFYLFTPLLALAQTTQGAVSIVPVVEPQGGNAYSGTNAPVVAIGLSNTGLNNALINSIVLGEQGSAPKTIFTGFSIETASGTLLGSSSGGLGTDSTVMVPVSSTIVAGSQEIFVAYASIANNVSPALGSSFTFSVVAVNSSATVAGALPVSGGQYVITSGTPPPTCIMNVNPGIISVGGAITLSWQSANATGGTITSVGSVGPSGSINLLPSSASYTTFVGTFTGPSGVTVSCQATVQVNSSSGIITGTTPASTPAPATPAASTPSSSGSLVPCGAGNGTPGSGDVIGINQTNSTGCSACDLGYLVENIITLLIGLSIPIAAGLFAWAGVLYFTSGANPGNIEKAKSIFRNALVGFLIAITAWLVINTLLQTLLAGSPTIPQGSWFTIQCNRSGRAVSGTIQTLLNSLPIVSTTQPVGTSYTCPSNYTLLGAGNTCIDNTNGDIINATPITSGSGGPVTQCTNSNCSVSSLQSNGMSSNVASVMSCIAQTENPSGSLCNGNACGTFQIMLSLNPLSGSACSPYPVTNCTGPSQCNAVGSTAQNLNSAACQTCLASEQKAALNPQCNAQSANALVQQSGYSSWTCPGCNSNAQACVSTYGSSN